MLVALAVFCVSVGVSVCLCVCLCVVTASCGFICRRGHWSSKSISQPCLWGRLMHAHSRCLFFAVVSSCCDLSVQATFTVYCVLQWCCIYVTNLLMTLTLNLTVENQFLCILVRGLMNSVFHCSLIVRILCLLVRWSVWVFMRLQFGLFLGYCAISTILDEKYKPIYRK